MAISVMFDFQGMTKQKYEELIQKLIATGKAPEGRLFHIASEKPNSLLVFDVWETLEKFQAFGGVLIPIAQGIGIAIPEPQVMPTVAAIAG
jgi:hypothetical protein